MKKDVILVLDCGATNVRAIAVDRQGKLSPAPQRPTPAISPWRTAPGTSGRWRRSCNASPMLSADCRPALILHGSRHHGHHLRRRRRAGDEQGKLLYPVISWKCPRTAAVMDNIGRFMPAQQLQQISGVGAFGFNTLYKLIWLKENHPQLLEQAHAWLFISSLLNHRLTGEFTTDITMAGTSQMLDIHQRDFSAQILQATGLPRRLFPGWLKRASRSARCKRCREDAGFSRRHSGYLRRARHPVRAVWRGRGAG
jgi:L-fuculokinase